MLPVLKLLLLLVTMGSGSPGSGVAAGGEDASGEAARGTHAEEGDMGPAVSIVVVKIWMMPCQHAATAVHRLDTMMSRH